MNSSELIVIELTKNWHTTFNSKILEIVFGIDANVRYIGPSQSLFCKPELNENIYWLKESKSKFNKYLHIVKLIISFNKKENFKILILSYELRDVIFLLFFKLFFFKRKIKLIEHNTIPSSSDSTIKKIAFIITNLAFDKIVLSRRVKQYLSNIYKKKSMYLPHPIGKPFKKQYIGKHIFSPSGTTSDSENYELIEKCSSGDEPIYIKSNTFNLNKPNVYCSRRFEDYDELMIGAKIVYIGGELFELRESGPLYEALNNKKTLLMNQGGLYRELKSKGFDVRLLEEYTPGIIIEFNDDKYKKFICHHGDKNVKKYLEKILENE